MRVNPEKFQAITWSHKYAKNLQDHVNSSVPSVELLGIQLDDNKH